MTHVLKIAVIAVCVGIGVLVYNKYTQNDTTTSKLSTLQQEPAAQLLLESTGASTQVFLRANGKQEQVSSVEDANHTAASMRGDFAVWIQQPHGSSEAYVVRYHFPTGTLHYVTSKGVGAEPRVTTEGWVVWKMWNETGWEVWYFNGIDAKKVVEVDAHSVDMFGMFIVYSRVDTDGQWVTEEYSLQTGGTRLIKKGLDAKSPRYDGSEIYFD